MSAPARSVPMPLPEGGISPEETSQTTVALLPWGLLYEDFLDAIGVSLDAFCTEMTGGYLFNHVDALRGVGIRAVIVLVSARVREPTRRVHAPTGAPILILPPPRSYLAFRHLLFSRAGRRVFGRGKRGLGALLREVAGYTATPLRPLLRELRREGCDAILCQEYEYARCDVLALAARRMGIPVFATFQGGTPGDGWLERRVRPLALRRAAGVIVGPRREAERVRERYDVADAKIARIFNPVDPHATETVDRAEARRALGIPPEARVAMWHGRVERHVKGLDVLLDAWERVCRERPTVDLRLLLVGSGGDDAWLRERVAAEGVRGVRWLDEYIHDRARLRLHLSAADVYAFPSRHEGFPVAPIEAMACGLPVVAAEAPGIPDILEGGEAAGGVVVPRGDADAFARALGRVLDDEALGREWGKRAAERVERCFSLGAVGEQLRTFLSEQGVRISLEHRPRHD